GLPQLERDLTSEVLGYPRGSIGRRMSPEYVTTRPELTAAQTIERVRARMVDAETIYTVPVVDGQRRLVGVVSLRDLLNADPHTPVVALAKAPRSVTAIEDAEVAARKCAG